MRRSTGGSADRHRSTPDLAGNLHFAGEHTSLELFGCLDPAVDTGERAAQAASPGRDPGAAHGAFSAHTMSLVAADDVQQVNRFLLPGMKVCTSTITPASDRPLPPAS